MNRIIVLTLLVLCVVAVPVDAGKNKFSAKLTGDQVVPPTSSKGSATINFMVNTKFGGLYYEINVSNLENIVSSHIHLGRFGSEGPVVATLLSGIPLRSGHYNGRIHSGIVFAQDLVGPFERSTSLTTLLSQIRTGNAYACVHTRNGSSLEESGNFPDGEVRGQIR
jgi:hypothetical protein